MHSTRFHDKRHTKHYSNVNMELVRKTIVIRPLAQYEVLTSNQDPVLDMPVHGISLSVPPSVEVKILKNKARLRIRMRSAIFSVILLQLSARVWAHTGHFVIAQAQPIGAQPPKSYWFEWLIVCIMIGFALYVVCKSSYRR